jgi:arylsulfatase A
MHDYYNWRLEYNDSVRRADGRYLTDLWTEEAVEFIRRHRAEPFFLHLTYNAPHTPLQAPEEEVRPFAETGKFTKGVSTLYGMIRRMDAGVGRVLEALRETGIEENTIVLFSSDNGPQFGGRGEGCLTRFNCNYNGAKGSVYEGGIRVPMILRWPAGIEGRREVDATVHFCDWLPTLLEMAGAKRVGKLPLDGASVLPLLRGQAPPRPPRRFWQWNRYTPLVESNAAMRDGDWKLVRPAIAEAMHVPQDDLRWLWVSMYGPEHFISQGLVTAPEPERSIPAPPEPQLFNLAQDPREEHDLAAVEADRKRRMLGELETWFESVEADRASIADEW